jgi:N6-L-threonylcarbamoyladenine synthase
MRVLGIETSCDETSAAVLSGDSEVLSNVVLSQDEIHAPYGGVVPELASRQHTQAIDGVVREALERARMRLEQVDLLAVTQGPGLIGSLLVGLSFAKGLAFYFGRPLVGVDHVEAHIEAALLENPQLPFPALALVVSGGHTSLFFLEKPLSFALLGRTRDDAAGEALDKVAKFLGLGYPGGPVIEKLGAGGDPRAFPFSPARMSDRSLDFSFSGLKTAALKTIRQSKIGRESRRLADFLASFEQAVADSILENLGRALPEHPVQSLILCGGVARNKRLRAEFEKVAVAEHLAFAVPTPKMCTDNAAMVASLGLRKFRAGGLGAFVLDLGLNAYPRVPPSAGEG